MSVYVTATATIKDPTKFQAYLSALPETLAPFGGVVISRGKVTQTLHGLADFQLIATIEFKDEKTVEAWYRSPAYQALIPNRDEAVDSTIVVLA